VAFWRWLKRLGLRLKNESLYAQERETEASLERRREFLQLIATIDLERLLFLDESGITMTMTRLYGCAAGGWSTFAVLRHIW
jgi:hypothetical protein